MMPHVNESMLSDIPGRCHCFEKLKHLEDRQLTIRSYYPSKVWGRAAKSYDGRKLLIVCCEHCHRTWKDYRKDSPLWRLLGDEPYSGPEKIRTINVRRDD